VKKNDVPETSFFCFCKIQTVDNSKWKIKNWREIFLKFWPEKYESSGRRRPKKFSQYAGGKFLSGIKKREFRKILIRYFYFTK